MSIIRDTEGFKCAPLIGPKALPNPPIRNTNIMGPIAGVDEFKTAAPNTM